jgi:hypothetical protein
MGATSRARTLTHAVTETAYSREFLERMARILVHSGHSPRQLVREFRGICSALKNPSTAGIPVSSLISQIFPRSLRFGMPILVAGPLVALFAAASTAQDAVAGACYSIISVLILSDSPQESRR